MDKEVLENGSEVAYSDMIVAREKKTQWVFKETERVNLRAWSQQTESGLLGMFHHFITA